MNLSYLKNFLIFTLFLICGLMFFVQSASALSLDLNFNSNLDAFGDLVFNGSGGLQVTFTDDESNGSHGNANGVHITNKNYGNIKVGNSTDFVLGAFNLSPDGGVNNYHSSGIVAVFNMGVTSVSFFDTDNDSTTKTLFAFDQNGTLIGQTSPLTQTTATINTSMTGGNLIYKIEFDTQAGTAGGSHDGTVFTIDDFHVEYNTAVPEPTSIILLGISALGLLIHRKMR